MSQTLSDKLSAVRRKQALVAAGRGLAAMGGLAVLMLAGGMLVDWLIELPRVFRAALLAMDVTVLSYIFLWHVAAPVLFAPDDEEMALLVERAHPEFRTRLIASVQLAHPQAVAAGASRALVQAMISQTEALARPMDFAAIIRTDNLFKTIALVVVIFVLGAGSYAYTHPVSYDLLQRALLVPGVSVPRNTRVVCLTQNRRIAIGDPVSLEAAAEGVVPELGRVDVEYASGRTQRFTLEPKSENHSIFGRTIESVQESFRYRVRLNDGISQWFNVEALPRPTLMGVEFQQHYPAYIKRPAERRSPGDLSLLAGAKLQIKLTANKRIASGAVRLVGLEQSRDLMVSGKEGNELAGTIDIPGRGLTGISFHLVDEHGIASRNETVYPVDLIPDKAPTIKIVWPDRKEELAVQQARILVAFEATDDFGLGKVVLRHKREGEEYAQAQSIELDLSDQSDLRRVNRRYLFNLGNLKPLVPEGSSVEYWLEVQDGNTVTGPGKAASDPFVVRIVSELAKRADLQNRMNDQLGTIDYVTQDQEKLNQSLGALILEKK